jgi:hypothetical protein
MFAIARPRRTCRETSETAQWGRLPPRVQRACNQRRTKSPAWGWSLDHQEVHGAPEGNPVRLRLWAADACTRRYRCHGRSGQQPTQTVYSRPRARSAKPNTAAGSRTEHTSSVPSACSTNTEGAAAQPSATNQPSSRG